MKRELYKTKNEIVLSLENISISFSKNYKKNGVELTERKSVLKNISFNLNRGEIVALTGGNGSGKTTLFNIISGLLEQDSGNIFFNRTNITNWKPFKRAQAGIGRLFQDNHIFPNLSVTDNMCIASSDSFGEIPFISLLKKNKSKIIENERINTAKNLLAKFFNVTDNWLQKKAGELSYGEKRLLGLARIFMGNYGLILLDEPSAGVNEILIKKIQDMVKELTKRNITILLIDHEKEFVKEIADRVIYLKNGNIVTEGVPTEVFNKIELDNVKS